MKRMIDNKDYESLKNNVNDINDELELKDTPYIITNVVVENEKVLGAQVKDVENDITYNLSLGNQVEANPTLEGEEETLESVEIDGTKYKVGGGKQLYNNFIKITYNTIISAIVKVDSDRSDFLNGNDRALWDYLNYYGFTSADNFYPCSGINTTNNNVIYGVYAAWNSSRTARLYGMIGSVGSELFFYTGTTQISYIAL